MDTKATPETPGERLKAARKNKGLSQERLAELCGWTGSGRIANYEGDKRDPRSPGWIRLAKALDVPPAWLQFGDAASDYNVELGPPVDRSVPLISWVQAGSFHEPVDPYVVGDAEDWLPLPGRAGSRTYALRVRGISMEPEYHEGDIIFVDPDEEARHGSHVIVRLEHAKEATFKELVIEGDRRLLKALNPAWPDPLTVIGHDATIAGVVIAKYVDKRRRR